jgi:hypothetical protein
MTRNLPRLKNLVLTLMHGRHSVSIHFKTAAVVHSLLLSLELTHFLADSHALRNWADSFLTFLSMDTKQGPNPFADFAAALNFRLRW